MYLLLSIIVQTSNLGCPSILRKFNLDAKLNTLYYKPRKLCFMILEIINL